MQMPTYDDVIRFHGHLCPGVTFGYRAAQIALERTGAGRAPDEELVVIAENDACGLDAFQVLTGCTIGKGNLILRDFGKNAWTLVNRTAGTAVRIVVRPGFSIEELDPAFLPLRARVWEGSATPDEEEDLHRRLDAICQAILTRPEDEVFIIRKVEPVVPERARLFRTHICAVCGEGVAESRARVKDGRIVCIPCAGEYTRGW
ncbi:FmdE family protein [Methanofollis fontis]|uniref:Formylmethanofuran dehydrogenase n=1 Tax=Methanofollis fontis TaxID=2052832 RepID=A0A483CSR4_9EURY|nr:FmdE family protein [Methanofollis fontis]TAJ45384.1 formylmethanofuran dehydrogenase [Methanofollis fontis]